MLRARRGLCEPRQRRRVLATGKERDGQRPDAAVGVFEQRPERGTCVRAAQIGGRAEGAAARPLRQRRQQSRAIALGRVLGGVRLDVAD